MKLGRYHQRRGFALFETLIAISLVSAVLFALSLFAGRLATLSYQEYHEQVAEDLIKHQLAKYHLVPEEIEGNPESIDFVTDSRSFRCTIVSRRESASSRLYRVDIRVEWEEKSGSKVLQKITTLLKEKERGTTP